MSDNKDTTTVQTAEIDLNDLLGTPGAQNIMLPENEAKPNLFTRKPVDLSFLDKPDPDGKTDPNPKSGAEADPDKKDPENKGTGTPEAAAAAAKGGSEDLDDIINNKPEDKNNPDDKDDSKKGGRPTGLAELGAKLIEKGYITPFEGEEDITKYTIKDWEELFEANEKEKDTKKYNDISKSFYEALPEEFQVASQYLANGGKDLKALFHSLAAVEEIRQLDTSTEEGQEQIVRSYLYATNFGNAEEIEQELEDWKDQDKLEAKANQFKPKLDIMQKQIVQKKLQDSENRHKAQMKQAQLYTDNIYKTLEPGELNGLKLDKKTQNLLFSGLTQGNFVSTSGQPTNMLGHLLEKYQYIEPNHGLISEALWLLADPEGYRSKVREGGKKDADAKTSRLLKQEQNSKITSTSQEDDDSANRSVKKGGIQRPNGGSFFKR